MAVTTQLSEKCWQRSVWICWSALTCYTTRHLETQGRGQNHLHLTSGDCSFQCVTTAQAASHACWQCHTLPRGGACRNRCNPLLCKRHLLHVHNWHMCVLEQTNANGYSITLRLDAQQCQFLFYHCSTTTINTAAVLLLSAACVPPKLIMQHANSPHYHSERNKQASPPGHCIPW